MIKEEIRISKNAKIKDAIQKINDQKKFFILFVIENDKIIGAITDGDIRRGFIKGCKMDDSIDHIMNKNFISLNEGEYEADKIDFINKYNLSLVPLFSKRSSLVKLCDFTNTKSVLPIDAVIMAGGKGERLKPLTDNTPKPMLKIGDKPIIEYNLDLLKYYGINNINISVNYLSDKITSYFKDGSKREQNISYVMEDKPLGTIGALKNIQHFHNDYIILMNSDLLTNINLDAMFRKFNENDADMIIANTDYQVQIPYGVIETENNMVKALKEKPTYTYFSNAGIYIFKRELVDLIPENTFYNATNLLEKLLSNNKKVLYYTIKNYWLDIGQHRDFKQANIDVININF